MLHPCAGSIVDAAEHVLKPGLGSLLSVVPPWPQQKQMDTGLVLYMDVPCSKHVTTLYSLCPTSEVPHCCFGCTHVSVATPLKQQTGSFMPSKVSMLLHQRKLQQGFYGDADTSQWALCLQPASGFPIYQ